MYIATFFTHFDAMAFAHEVKQAGFSAQLMPVPRRLSSSCGTCVRFSLADNDDPAPWQRESMERMVRVEGEDFSILWDNRL